MAALEEEVATSTKELAEVVKSQAKYDTWHAEYEATCEKNRADTEAGTEGVRIASMWRSIWGILTGLVTRCSKSQAWRNNECLIT